MQKNSETIAYAFNNCFRGTAAFRKARAMRSEVGLWRFWKPEVRWSLRVFNWSLIPALCLWYLSSENIFLKVFEGEMLIRKWPISLLQIFVQFMIYLKVILESIIGPEDTHHGNLQALISLPIHGLVSWFHSVLINMSLNYHNVKRMSIL